MYHCLRDNLSRMAGDERVIGGRWRVTGILASGTMAVAYIQFHWKLAFADAMWIPALNKGELAVLYCFVLLFIAERGGGAASAIVAWGMWHRGQDRGACRDRETPSCYRRPPGADSRGMLSERRRSLGREGRVLSCGAR